MMRLSPASTAYYVKLYTTSEIFLKLIMLVNLPQSVQTPEQDMMSRYLQRPLQLNPLRS